MSGWIIVPRSYFAGGHWAERREFSRAEAILDLYQTARWEDGNQVVNGKVIPLRRGELIASLRYLEARWGWKKDRVSRFLATMRQQPRQGRDSGATEDETQLATALVTETRQGETVIILCNYEDWADPDPNGRDSGATPNATRAATQLAEGPRQERDTDATKLNNKIISKKEPLSPREGTSGGDDLFAKSAPAPAAKPTAEAIVGSYPRREAVAECLQIVAKDIANGTDPVAMLAGTQAIAGVIATLPSGALNAYVIGASRFFREKRWQDDPDTWRRQATKAAEAKSNGKPGLTPEERRRRLGGRVVDISDDEVKRALGGRADLGEIEEVKP